MTGKPKKHFQKGGSRVRHTTGPNSDLDLVAFTSPTQRRLVGKLRGALSESNLPFVVDLHVWNEIPEKFHEIIRKEYVVLQEAEPEEAIQTNHRGLEV
jgi:uncharacterized protein